MSSVQDRPSVQPDASISSSEGALRLGMRPHLCRTPLAVDNRVPGHSEKGCPHTAGAQREILSNTCPWPVFPQLPLQHPNPPAMFFLMFRRSLDLPVHRVLQKSNSPSAPYVSFSDPVSPPPFLTSKPLLLWNSRFLIRKSLYIFNLRECSFQLLC